MEKVFRALKDNVGIGIILIIALVLRLLIMNELGVEYNMKSDDLQYVKSGITFLETGTITMHGVLSAQIMPGMTFIIAFLALIFGKGYYLMLSIKILWILMGLTSIYFVYRIVRIYSSKIAACISAAFLLGIDFAWIDNVVLTETPFMLCLIMLIYHSLMLEKTRDKKHFWIINVWYIIGVFLRQNIGIFPIFLILFLLWCGYDKKLLLKQTIISLAILLSCLLPWTIRNYHHFNRFIPLTYGSGNPMLLGTYQGEGYPHDSELDYKKNVDDKMSDEMYSYIYEGNREKDYMLKYYWLEHDKYKAKYRMEEWWKRDPKSMIYSYMVYKPSMTLYGTYSIDVLGIPSDSNLKVRSVELILFSLCSMIILLSRNYLKEFTFLIGFYISQIALYAYTYSFSRYGQTLYCIRFIIIGIGLGILFNYIKFLYEKFINKEKYSGLH